MATVNKNFRVKNGLVVEGSTATVNGQNILTETGSDTYILNLIGGETLVKSVESTQLDVDGSGKLSIKSNVYDAYGSASTAEGNANDYTDTKLGDYTKTADLDTTVDGYGYLKSGDLPTMYSNSDVDNHLSGGDGINYSSGTISADLGSGLGIDGSAKIEINRTTVDAWYDANGAASDVQDNLDTHTGASSAHGVTGDIVGTSDTQTLSNKAISGQLQFGTDGAHINDYNGSVLSIYGNQNVDIIATNGAITLQPTDGAYIGYYSSENEIATHAYVDNAVSGLTWKQAVNLHITTNIADLNNAGGTYDGHALGQTESGYRLLLTGQSTASQNGIYVAAWVSGAVHLSRPADADTYNELIGAAVFVEEGTVGAGTGWVQSNHYLTSFSGQSWTKFSASTAYITSVGSNLTVTNGELTVDLSSKQGVLTASTGITIDGSNNISVTSNTYDAYGAASQALSDANDYADGLASNYDASGTASSVGNAITNGTTAFSAINVNSVAKEVAATATITTAGSADAITWSASSYKSAKAIIKFATATNTQVSEILLTIDSSGNIAITDYAEISTSSALGTISASYNAGTVAITVTTLNNNTTVVARATLLV